MAETKDLNRLTATKLREIAKEYPDIQGAHAMKKAELIAAICAARGEPIPVTKKGKKKPKVAASLAEMKKQIRSLKVDQEKAISSGDKALLRRLRRKIRDLKRDTRKAAAAK